MSDLTLHFVRHGESLANEADKAGRERPEDWDGLSERGWEQARGLGRRLEGEGIEVIVASTMRRAQETAQGINEVLGLEIETDPDLHELKQSDAFYALARRLRRHRVAELDADRAARLRRAGRRVVRRRCSRACCACASGWRRARATSGSCSSPTTAGCTSSSALTLFGDAFGPEHLLGLWLAGHANTGISVFERRARRMDGMDFSGLGPDHLERSGPPVAAGLAGPGRLEAHVAQVGHARCARS